MLGRFPPQGLSREQEERLADRIHGGDQQARNELVEANRGFAHLLAGKASRRWGLDDDECLAACERGLLQAAERFNAGRGAKFCTYAAYWMRNYLIELVRQRERGPCDAPPGSRLAAAIDGVLGVDDATSQAIDPDPLEPFDHAVLAERRDAVRDAVAALEDRLRRILIARFWDGRTLDDCAAEMRLSKERIRQLETRALQRLRLQLLSHAEASP